MWFLNGGKETAIITLRVSILKNQCQLLINSSAVKILLSIDVFISKTYLTGSGWYFYC